MANSSGGKSLGAMSRMRAAMKRMKPTPGDVKSDLLVVIASRLIMNGGNSVSANDVVNASKMAPADRWIKNAFGSAYQLTSATVEQALSKVKEHFTKSKDGRFVMKGWPLARRLECRINEDWGAEWRVDERLGVEKNVGKNAGARPKGKRETRTGRINSKTMGPGGAQTTEKKAPSGKRREHSGRPTGRPAKKPNYGKETHGKSTRNLPSDSDSGFNEGSDEDEELTTQGKGGQNGGTQPPNTHTLVEPGDVSSIIRFFGDPRVGDMHRHRTYYNGFDVLTREGDDLIEAKYRAGDLVYCLPGSENEAMYLAQIESVFSDPNGQWVECAWLERSEEIEALIGPDAWKEVDALDNEVFLTLAVNTNAVQTIEGKCRVVTEAQYVAERDSKDSKNLKESQNNSKALPSKKDSSAKDIETFVCRRALVGTMKPPDKRKEKNAGRSNPQTSVVSGMFAPVTFEPGKGFRVVLPGTGSKAKKGKGKGKR